ncbi:uncharacterized protein A4U43_C10F12160 [Asparagus officinalis]|uniref:Uncharacterized protein n=1 Tax=Asparagus officinalis TaxID=4686 RepID=A0A5P1E2G8_ASPOF|nr:uncharacterized protein A4U43_C10F12160 [Asparagus officinalis]
MASNSSSSFISAINNKGKEKLVNFKFDSHDDEQEVIGITSEDETEEEETDDDGGGGCRFSFGELMEEVRPPIGLPKKSFGNLKEALKAKFPEELQKVESPAAKKLRAKRVAKMRLKRINMLCQKKEEAAVNLALNDTK